MIIDITKTKGLRIIYLALFADMFKVSGGKSVMLSKIRSAYEQGHLTQKQEYDLRRKINEVCDTVEK